MAKAKRKPSEANLEGDFEPVEGVQEEVVVEEVVEEEVKEPEAPPVQVKVEEEIPMSVLGPDATNINFHLLMKLCWALGMGSTGGYTGIAGIRRIGQMFGAKDFEGEKLIWVQIKAYMLNSQKG